MNAFDSFSFCDPDCPLGARTRALVHGPEAFVCHRPDPVQPPADDDDDEDEEDDRGSRGGNIDPDDDEDDFDDDEDDDEDETLWTGAPPVALTDGYR